MEAVDLNEIAVFIKVVQAGSFTRAAQQLSMPNSTVSTRISSLESRLGVTLLQRTTRQLSLTEVGRAYYEQCLAGLEEINKAEIEVTSAQREPSGTLRVTAPVFLGALLLGDVLAECSERYPNIHLEVILQDRVIHLINENVDVAIRGGDLQDSSLIARRLGFVRFALFASPSYLRKNKSPVHPKDIKNHRCLQFSAIGRDGWKFFNGKNTVSVPIDKGLLIDDLHLIKSLALEGCGLALLPVFDCDREVKKKELVSVLPNWTSIKRELHIVYAPQRFPSPKVQAFVSMASEKIKTKLSRFD